MKRIILSALILIFSLSILAACPGTLRHVVITYKVVNPAGGYYQTLNATAQVTYDYYLNPVTGTYPVQCAYDKLTGYATWTLPSCNYVRFICQTTGLDGTYVVPETAGDLNDLIPAATPPTPSWASYLVPYTGDTTNMSWTHDVTTTGKGTFGTFKLGTSTTAGFVLTADSSGNGTWQTLGLASYVPYTGATGNADLGAWTFKAGNLNIATSGALKYNGNNFLWVDSVNHNTFLGLQIIPSGTLRTFNTYIGDMAGANSYNSIHNTIIGAYSGTGDDGGYANTVVGSTSLEFATSGNNNAIVGHTTATNISTGEFDSCLGNGAGQYWTDASYNTAAGGRAGGVYADNSPDFCTFLGYETDVNGSNIQNTTVVGYGARATASNVVQLGNSSVTAGYLGSNQILTTGYYGSALTAEVDAVIGNEVKDTADTTLTRSGTGTTGDPYKLAINEAYSHTWSTNQTAPYFLTSTTFQPDAPRPTGIPQTAVNADDHEFNEGTGTSGWTYHDFTGAGTDSLATYKGYLTIQDSGGDDALETYLSHTLTASLTGNFDIIVKVGNNALSSSNYPRAGFFLTTAVGTGVGLWQGYAIATRPVTYNSTTTTWGTALGGLQAAIYGTPQYLRISRATTTITYSISGDGMTWQALGTSTDNPVTTFTDISLYSKLVDQDNVPAAAMSVFDYIRRVN